MSHINVASTKALLGTYFGNIDAGNWSLAKEQLVLVLDGADHLVPLKTASIVPAMLRLADFTKAGVVDTVGWYNHQQSHADATAKSTTIIKTAKAHLRMCVGQATYDMAKELPVHEQWAKLESSFAATSSTVDRSAKLVKLINMQPFVTGDDFEVWIATFNMSVKALNNAVKHAKSANTCTTCDPLDALIVKDWLCNLMPETFASTVNSVNDSDDLEKLVQQLRRAALGDCARCEQTQAHIAHIDQA
ncbi:BQ5605_C045g12196 [Microbotryum silenes-dioicae]|uniref:BQ5605_C045g12196 protein n=1 Tax=Microbotryum silenes-dioicae TaxID=796604 RepID=A0A2X0MQD9_9BASI|nr:BQ5605_C045g12196 [Microbotryum silenes-dioicae]